MGEQSGFRIEHDTMGEVRVPADALWRAQTQRAVENFPISGRGLERAQIRALGLVKARRGAREQATSACWTGRRGRDRRGRRRGRRGRARRPLPRRRVPDRLGHQLQHERQRGDRHPRRPRRGLDVHPNDHVNASQSSQRRLPDHDPPRRHRGAGHRRRPRAGAPRRRAAPPRRRLGRRRQGRSHPPHGRRADHAGPGGGRLGHPGRVRRRPGPRRAAPAGAAADRRHGRRHRAQRAATGSAPASSSSCARPPGSTC